MAVFLVVIFHVYGSELACTGETVLALWHCLTRRVSKHVIKDDVDISLRLRFVLVVSFVKTAARGLRQNPLVNVALTRLNLLEDHFFFSLNPGSFFLLFHVDFLSFFQLLLLLGSLDFVVFYRVASEVRYRLALPALQVQSLHEASNAKQLQHRVQIDLRVELFSGDFELLEQVLFASVPALLISAPPRREAAAKAGYKLDRNVAPVAEDKRLPSIQLVAHVLSPLLAAKLHLFPLKVESIEGILFIRERLVAA